MIAVTARILSVLFTILYVHLMCLEVLMMAGFKEHKLGKLKQTLCLFLELFQKTANDMSPILGDDSFVSIQASEKQVSFLHQALQDKTLSTNERFLNPTIFRHS